MSDADDQPAAEAERAPDPPDVPRGTSPDSAAGPRSTAERPPRPDPERPHVDARGRTMKKPRAAARKPRDRTRSSSGGQRSLRAPLTRTLAVVSVAVSSRDPFVGASIAAQAEDVARALDDVAQDSPRVHRVLSTLTATGGAAGWASVAVAAAPVATAVLWRSGALPDTDTVRSSVPDEAIAAGIAAGQLTEDGRPIPRDDDQNGNDDDGPPATVNGARPTRRRGQ